MENTMKKLFSFILILALCLSLFACKKSYEPIESTEEEAATVMTVTAGGVELAVPYEVYRAFFLEYKAKIDGGDDSVWRGEDKDEYITAIDALIIERIGEIYSVFALCKSLGIDTESEVVEETIYDYLVASIEGGTVDGMELDGFGGDYDAYLAHLKEKNMNYSVQNLLFRYSVCLELLGMHYAVQTDGGKVEYTREDVEEFYYGDDCVRVLQLFLSERIYTAERAAQIRDRVAEAAGDEWAVGTAMLMNSSAAEELRDGTVIGRYALDADYYGELVKEAFGLEIGEVGKVIRIVTGLNDGYYLIYRTEKSAENFDGQFEEIEAVYLQNRLGEDLAEMKTELIGSAEYTDVLTNLDRGSVEMK